MVWQMNNLGHNINMYMKTLISPLHTFFVIVNLTWHFAIKLVVLINSPPMSLNENLYSTNAAVFSFYLLVINLTSSINLENIYLHKLIKTDLISSMCSGDFELKHRIIRKSRGIFFRHLNSLLLLLYKIFLTLMMYKENINVPN